MSDIEKMTEQYPIPENRCVCCGEVIPEGYQVCAKCEESKIGARIFSPILHVAVLLGILALAMILCGENTVYTVVIENKNRLFYTLYLLAGFLLIYILVIDVWENKKYSKKPPVFL